MDDLKAEMLSGHCTIWNFLLEEEGESSFVKRSNRFIGNF